MAGTAVVVTFYHAKMVAQMAERWHTEQVDRLAEAVLALETRDEAAAFLRDLCSLHELETLGHRLQVARLLDEGMPYARVASRRWAPPRPRSRGSPTGCATGGAATGRCSTG